MDETERKSAPDGGGNPARHIGAYKIVRELGRGGMGAVYLCEDTAVGDRLVAIKVIAGHAAEAPEHLERFRREIRNLGTLRHPNIVQVLYAGDHEGNPYFVMDFVAGQEMTKWLEALIGRPEPERIAAIVGLVIKVARAVDYAHSQGTIHRDLKPQNILVREDGEPLVLDFGIAKHREDVTLTVGHQAPGTPTFMAPEQFEHELAVKDELIDVWALGTILYLALTRDRPFKGHSLASVSYHIVHTAPVSPRKLNAAIPLTLEGVIASCLEKDPHRRPQSAEILADLLERAMEVTHVADRSRKTRTVLLVVLGAVVVAALVLRPWRLLPGANAFRDARVAVTSIGGAAVVAGGKAVAVPTFDPVVQLSVEGVPSEARLEAVLVDENGAEVSARVPLVPRSGGREALFHVAPEKRSEALCVDVRLLADGKRLAVEGAGGPCHLRLDAMPPRVRARMKTPAGDSAWPTDTRPVECVTGTRVAIVAEDAGGPVVATLTVTGAGTGEAKSTADDLTAAPADFTLAVAGEWSVFIDCKDAAGNRQTARFSAVVRDGVATSRATTSVAVPPDPAPAPTGAPSVALVVKGGAPQPLPAGGRVAVDLGDQVEIAVRDLAPGAVLVVKRPSVPTSVRVSPVAGIAKTVVAIRPQDLTEDITLEAVTGTNKTWSSKVVLRRLLPKDLGRLILVEKQTENDKTLKPLVHLHTGRNAVSVTNLLGKSGFTWKLRIVEKLKGAKLAEATLDSAFETSIGGALTGSLDIPMTAKPGATVSYRAELVLTDAAGNTEAQRLEGFTFDIEQPASRPNK